MAVEATAWRVECDRCLRQTDSADSEADAEKEARREGWVEVKGEWVCNECLEDLPVEWHETLRARYALADWELRAMIDRDERTVAWLVGQRPRLTDCLEEIEQLRGTP